MLTLATAALCSAISGEHHIRLATSVEFMHTATLLHDDVVDESDLRRGKSSARMIWGNQASVLVGDFLLGQAFRMMVETGSMEALSVLSDAAAVIAEGEVLQLSVSKKMETTRGRLYRRHPRQDGRACSPPPPKSGRLSPSATSDADRKALRDYGMALGIAFQLVDDVLDYGGRQRRSRQECRRRFPRGQGDACRSSSPISAAMTDEKAFWRNAIEGGENDDAALEKARFLLEKHGALADSD